VDEEGNDLPDHATVHKVAENRSGRWTSATRCHRRRLHRRTI